MITAVDTNVLLDVLSAGPHLRSSLAALDEARLAGSMLVCEVVYAELSAAFRGDVLRLDQFLSDASIRMERSHASTLADAGSRWRRYRVAGGSRERMVADFLIGAHALGHAERLLTRDRGFYRRWFTELDVRDPSAD